MRSIVCGWILSHINGGKSRHSAITFCRSASPSQRDEPAAAFRDEQSACADLAELETSELVLVTIFDSNNNKKNADSIDSTERLVRVVINREEERLSKNLSLLATISSSAPYIGLLGTVIGIINAFQGLSTTAQLTLSSVAPGISEALVATAVGLLAAIPALIGFNQFSKQLDNLLNGSLAFAEELIIQIAKDK